jgi:hypothetical protein
VLERGSLTSELGRCCYRLQRPQEQCGAYALMGALHDDVGPLRALHGERAWLEVVVFINGALVHFPDKRIVSKMSVTFPSIWEGGRIHASASRRSTDGKGHSDRPLVNHHTIGADSLPVRRTR